MLPHQYVFLEEHRGNIYIKKINMNHLSPRTHLNPYLFERKFYRLKFHSWYTFRKSNDHILRYKLEENKMSILEVTDCITIDSELRLQPFFKGAPVLLPLWFCQEVVVCLTKV